MKLKDTINKKYAICVKNKEEFDKLMKIYEELSEDITWHSGERPSAYDWEMICNKLCISVGYSFYNKLGKSEIEFYKSEGYQIINFDELEDEKNIVKFEDLKVGDRIKERDFVFVIIDKNEECLQMTLENTDGTYFITNKFDFSTYEKVEEEKESSINELKGILKPQEKSLKEVLQEIKNITGSCVKLEIYNSKEVTVKIFERETDININFYNNKCYLDIFNEEKFDKDILEIILKVISLIEENIELFKFEDDSYEVLS